jgi:ethanolamine ammonia-lyase small subunit
MNEIILLNMLLAIVRNFVPANVYTAIKTATDAAIALPERGDGARTQAVLAEAAKVAATTRTQFDDAAIQIATVLVLRKAMARKKAA